MIVPLRFRLIAFEDPSVSALLVAQRLGHAFRALEHAQEILTEHLADR